MCNNSKHVLDLWITGVNSGNLNEVFYLYDENAILLPTFSNKLLNTTDSIRSYFIKLSSRNGLHVELHDDTLSVQNLSNDLYSVNGIYCWRFEVESELLSFEARFTFIIDLKRSSPIVHHHSSQVPRML